MEQPLRKRVKKLVRLLPHRHQDSLIEILSGKTSVSSTGYPYISTNSFRIFLNEVPHLFQAGEKLLKWARKTEGRLKESHDFSEMENESIQRAIRVLRNMVQSASICAPPDLWILRHVLSVHAQMELTNRWTPGQHYDSTSLAHDYALDERHLRWDLSLFYSRGYLRNRGGKFTIRARPQAQDLMRFAKPLDDEFLQDMVDPILDTFRSKLASERTLDLVKRYLTLPFSHRRRRGWVASQFELEIGYRILPFVLALHALNLKKEAMKGAPLTDLVEGLLPEARVLLEKAGIIQRNACFTALGLRVLDRGPGPFGIIHAYVPYMKVLKDRLSRSATQTWVQRGKNISASQDANRKTFEAGNDALDRFCADNGFQYSVFIEHALGLGEATRQRLQRNGEQQIQYFGADLEDAAIDRAEVLQKEGVLPKNMIFIRKADIANPEAILSGVRKNGFLTEGAVMFVGNGFHEIRGQTNERVIEIFRNYCRAGIIVVFTEESALNDHDLFATGWNTYHTGFRYVHELSGQGLRPAMGTDPFGRYSWKICASLGGYAVLPKYSEHTRTIFPFPRRSGYNPPISMTYFCVPSEMARNYGFYPTGWSSTKR